MGKFIEILLKKEVDANPSSHPPKMFLNTDQISHIHQDVHGRTAIHFANGEFYQAFETMQQIMDKIQPR